MKCKYCGQYIGSIVEKDICMSCEMIKNNIQGMLLFPKFNKKSRKYWSNKFNL